jgi:sulfur-oxidizing protein SoxY
MSKRRQLRAPRGPREVSPLALTDQGSRPGPKIWVPRGRPLGGVEGRRPSSVSRRDALSLAGAAIAASTLPAAAVDPGDFKAVFAETTRGQTPQMGRVKLTMPELAENGNVVSTLIEVQSPMTEKDHVKTISLLAEKNPTTLLFRVHLGPRSGRARVATNVRLADTQRIVAVAEMSDGSLWMGDVRVLVTLAACIDGG